MSSRQLPLCFAPFLSCGQAVSLRSALGRNPAGLERGDVDNLAALVTDESGIGQEDEDVPQSELEANADAEDARMNLLLDRVDAEVRTRTLDLHNEVRSLIDEVRQNVNDSN